MADDEPAFLALLGRININDDTANSIVTAQGINHMQTLVDMVTEEQVKGIAKLVSYAPGLGVDDNFVSAVSATKLHAVWYWGVLRERCGRALSADAQVLTDAEITRTIQRIQYEKQAKEAAEDGEPKKPFVLKKIEKFNEWLDAFNAYMYSIRGAARIPLPYVYRTEAEVTEEMRNETYPNTDEEYMTLFALQGSYYDVDNARVFNELMQFVLGGPGESVVKPHRARRNGRGAMLALVAYANGTDAIELRASNAYQVINSTIYKRQSKNFTLDDFFARLRDAYNVLEHEDVNQPVQELRKWTETLDKIQDPQLYAAKLAIKTSVKGENEKTFENLAAKVKELAHEVYKSRPQDRMISLTDTEPTRKKVSFKDSELHAGNWPSAEWNKLTSEQKKKVGEMRRAAKQKRKNTDRSAKAAGTAGSDSEGGSEDEKTEEAGKQFGRNAHKSKKKSKK